MPKHRIQLSHQFASTPDQVFEFFSDHLQFGRIWPGKTRRVRDGDTESNGLGSVREIQVGPIRFEETVVSFARPQRIEYTITRGSPLKNHHGRIEFHPDGSGCRVDYQIEFDGRFPLIGAHVARQLPKDFQRGLQALQHELP
jgi:uncharacterized protein YndB with AHSA1/START domain